MYAPTQLFCHFVPRGCKEVEITDEGCLFHSVFHQDGQIIMVKG